MSGFASIDPERRMEFLHALDTIQCESSHYTDRGICVMVGPSFSALDTLVKTYGWRVPEDGLWYFPLGSDRRADHLRHAVPGKYDGARGFTLTAHVLTD